MKNLFEIAAGSVAGRNHQLAGKNSHDAFCCLFEEEAIIAVVSDGCGSGRHSEVGAKLGARLLAASIYENVKRLSQRISVDNFFLYWERVRQDVLAQLRVLTNAMGGSFSENITDYFLFTIVGAIITPRVTFIFSLGDGFICVNGEITQIGPFPGNEPPYLAYGLTGSSVIDQHPELLQFQVYPTLPTKSLQSLLLGTDGVKDLVAAANRRMPGKNELFGPLSQFWEKDSYFKNPDMVRRRLALANRDVTSLDSGSFSLTKEPGLLPDDTTIVVIRRKNKGEG